MTEERNLGSSALPDMPSQGLTADQVMALGEVLPGGPTPDLDETFHQKPENQWL